MTDEPDIITLAAQLSKLRQLASWCLGAAERIIAGKARPNDQVVLSRAGSVVEALERCAGLLKDVQALERQTLPPPGPMNMAGRDLNKLIEFIAWAKEQRRKTNGPPPMLPPPDPWPMLETPDS